MAILENGIHIQRIFHIILLLIQIIGKVSERK